MGKVMKVDVALNLKMLEREVSGPLCLTSSLVSNPIVSNLYSRNEDNKQLSHY